MSTSNKICNDGASKSNDDGVCEINDKLQNMRTTGEEENASPTCANCGKGEESSDSLKACAACKLVKYCSRECQIAHRPQHKKECKKRAAELHDEKLFKQPSPPEDCPICMMLLPSLVPTGKKYQTCCGKTICSGCFHANAKIDINKLLCPFCRIPTPDSDAEAVKRIKKRMEAGDAEAINNLGYYYAHGMFGYTQNHAKALKLYHRAGELGSADAYYNIGRDYYFGHGVEVDKKKARHYYELAAMGGARESRHNLGSMEAQAGNMDRAIKHYMISAGAGDKKTLDTMQKMYSNGLATKEDYTKALQAYQAYLDEIKSAQRDEAAAFDNDYKYIG